MDDVEENEVENPNKKFAIDTDAIQRINQEDQDAELQALGLSVFDQSVYEKGVISQVGKALTGNSDHFLEGDSCPSEQEEGELDGDIGDVKEHDDNTVDSPVKKKSIVKSTNDDTVSNIEEYLKKQLKLHETKKLQGQNTPKSNKVSPVLEKKKNSVQHPKPFVSNKKSVGTKKQKKGVYLGPSPKKKRKKNKLGTRKGTYRKGSEPGLQPGEESYFYVNTSGSEAPTHDSGDDQDEDPEETEVLPEEREKILEKKEERLTSGSEYVPSESDSDYESKPKRKRQAKPSKKNKKPRKEYLFYERIDTDDSDWDSSDDVPKRKGVKELDDGDPDIYSRRMKEFERSLSTKGVVSVEGDFVIPKDIWEKLYEYQKKAVKWFWSLNQKMTGGILGDEMGLGKTVQVIAFLAGLHRSCLHDEITRYEGLGPTLIVCPTTVMHQWVREFHNWYPPLRVVILHDSGTYKGKDRTKLIKIIHRDGSHGVIITSYNGLFQYRETILPLEWHYVVLDEGHKIRNYKAKVTETAKLLDTPHRLILSGSPLQNNLQELWCLFDFVCPGKLGPVQGFMETFAAPIMQGGYANASKAQVIAAHKCATILKDTITPFLLRRMKEDVNAHINLPGKKEQVLFCRLTDEQREIYKEYIERIDVQEMIRGRAKIFVALINMRKICNHPDLYSGGPDRNYKINPGEDPPKEDHFGYWKRAGKMIVIESLLKIWSQQNHRVLLFTQSKKMLLIMEDFVKRKKYKYLKLDGQTAVASRQPLIDKFNKDESYFLMLLTTKVGGLGVNLTGANRVVIYDPDWNPATDTQARERAWRIGQQRDVTIYRLITAGTIEEKIYHRQIFKQFLSNKILKDPKQRRFFKSNDLLELFTLSETVKNGTTETAAIFAGTGSEISIPKKIDVSSKEKVVFSESKIEQMKKLAHALSKKIGENNKTENSIYGPDDNLNSSRTSIPGTSVKIEEESPIYGPDGSLNKDAICKVITPSCKEKTGVPSAGTNSSGEGNLGCTTSSNPAVAGKKGKKKHKEKKKDKEVFAKFEGKEVPHLVKKRKYKKSEESEREYMSQDDYVLKKLFSKGLETAMRHDTIIEGGPSDYAIVEAEAERVAQGALKALKESQETTPAFLSILLRKRKAGDNDLIDIIKKRNLIVDPSLNDKSLLSNMITWLQGQGGTSSSEQMVNAFKYKLGAGKNPLFKSLLEKIATFYRGPDKVGYWTIREEFNMISPAAGTSGC